MWNRFLWPSHARGQVACYVHNTYQWPQDVKSATWQVPGRADDQHLCLRCMVYHIANTLQVSCCPPSVGCDAHVRELRFASEQGLRRA